jgi:hypothetical protein
MPKREQHARGSSKARWEQHAQGERHKKYSTDSMKLKISLFLASNLKMTVYDAPYKQ